MSVRNAPGAGFGIHILGQAFADGVHAAAGMKLRFENGDLVPRVLQFPSRGQPGQSCAEDRNPLGASGPRRDVVLGTPSLVQSGGTAHWPQARVLRLPAIDWHDWKEYYPVACVVPIEQGDLGFSFNLRGSSAPSAVKGFFYSPREKLLTAKSARRAAKDAKDALVPVEFPAIDRATKLRQIHVGGKSFPACAIPIPATILD